MHSGFSAFAHFWQQYWSHPSQSRQHPNDVAFFKQVRPRGHHRDAAKFDFTYHPCPFDGPLENAKVILCLANPRYVDLPGSAEHKNRIIEGMRDGRSPLPDVWLPFYKKTFNSFLKEGLDEAELKSKFAVFNICAYASENMNGPEVAHAAGLPSTWAAQNYLRSVLIPRAQQTGHSEDVYLIFLRKHQLWGVTEGFAGNIEIVRGRELGGVVPQETAKRVMKWLSSKRLRGYSSPKHEQSIRKSVSLMLPSNQPTFNVENSIRTLATLTYRAESALRRLELATIPSELLEYLSKLITQLQKLKSPLFKNRGSATLIPNLVRELEKRGYPNIGELVDWIYQHKDSEDLYLPFGELRYGDLGSYSNYLIYCDREKVRLAEHQKRQQEQEKDAQERQAMRKVTHLKKQNRVKD